MNDTPVIAPMDGLPDPVPSENSTLDELGQFALRMFGEFKAQDKKNGEYIWKMGYALQLAFEKIECDSGHGHWQRWYKAKGFTKTWQWQARTLYLEAPSLEAVVDLGLTESLIKFGVISPKKTRTETQTSTSPEAERDEHKKPTVTNNEEPTQPTDEADSGGDLAESDEEVPDDPAPDVDDTPTDPLAEEEEKELKEYQDALRQQTPKTRAVAIHHALELLRDELNADEVDEELQTTFGQIAELAEALKGLNKPTDVAEAA